MAASEYPPELQDVAESLPPLLSLAQACEVLHMSRATFTRIVAARELTTVKRSGGRNAGVLVLRTEVLRYLAERLRRRL